MVGFAAGLWVIWVVCWWFIGVLGGLDVLLLVSSYTANVKDCICMLHKLPTSAEG